VKKSELDGPPIRRLYYSSREISRLSGRDSQELRDWETRFPSLRPSKSKTGRRLYRPADMELVQTISDLLNKGLSDEAINQILRNPDEYTQPAIKKSDTPAWRGALRSMKEELQGLLQILDEDDSNDIDSLHVDHERENRIP
jgi:DNA-binding transcriptional MerR regulator